MLTAFTLNKGIKRPRALKEQTEQRGSDHLSPRLFEIKASFSFGWLQAKGSTFDEVSAPFFNCRDD